jgi:hypothetical protein
MAYGGRMKKWATLIAAVVLLAGCSGGSAPKASPSPKLVELADACVLVNQAAEDTLSDAGLAKPESLDSFAAELDTISGKTDSRGRDAVEDLATRARQASMTLATSTDVSERMDTGLDMLRGYKRLQDSCQAVGSPLSVPE